MYQEPPRGSAPGLLWLHCSADCRLTLSHHFPQTPAQHTLHPAPPVQSEVFSHLYGSHHRGPTPIAFAVHTSMKLSLSGFPAARMATARDFIGSSLA